MSWSTLLALPIGWLVWTVVAGWRLREFTDPARVDRLTDRERERLRVSAQTLSASARLLWVAGRPTARHARRILENLDDRGRPCPTDRERRWGRVVLGAGRLALIAFILALGSSGLVRTAAFWTLYVTGPLAVVLGAWVHLRNLDEQARTPDRAESEASDACRPDSPADPPPPT